MYYAGKSTPNLDIRIFFNPSFVPRAVGIGIDNRAAFVRQADNIAMALLRDAPQAVP